METRSIVHTVALIGIRGDQINGPEESGKIACSAVAQRPCEDVDLQIHIARRDGVA